MKPPREAGRPLTSFVELLTRPAFLAGAAILSFYLAVALIAPFLYPKGLTAMAINNSLVASCAIPPGPTLSLFPFSIGPHPFGETAFLGYGVAQGLIVGSRWDLMLIATVTLPAASLGVALGVISGGYGGKTDWVLMTVTDTMLSIPYFVFVILAVEIFTPRFAVSYGPLIFILSMVLVMWAPYARVVRGESLKASSMQYVESAKASGALPRQILVRHILPNSLTPALAQIPVTVALTLALVVAAQYVITLENTHSYGVGCTYNTAALTTAPVVPAFNYPEWGAVLSAGVAYSGAWLPQPGAPLGTAWWGYLIPALWITVFGLGVLFISDGIRDWASPRTRK